MNMGLILFLSSLLLGTPSDRETENYSEEPKKTSEEKINTETIINQKINTITIFQTQFIKTLLYYWARRIRIRLLKFGII